MSPYLFSDDDKKHRDKNILKKEVYKLVDKMIEKHRIIFKCDYTCTDIAIVDPFKFKSFLYCHDNKNLNMHISSEKTFKNHYDLLTEDEIKNFKLLSEKIKISTLADNNVKMKNNQDYPHHFINMYFITDQKDKEGNPIFFSYSHIHNHFNFSAETEYLSLTSELYSSLHIGSNRNGNIKIHNSYKKELVHVQKKCWLDENKNLIMYRMSEEKPGLFKTNEISRNVLSQLLNMKKSNIDFLSNDTVQPLLDIYELNTDKKAFPFKIDLNNNNVLKNTLKV